MIGMCVFGDDNDSPTLESFDGQFEGLAPRPEPHNLRAMSVGHGLLVCNYEAKFNDIRPH